MHHSELYSFAASYWWLIFPLGWSLVTMLQTWARHRRTQAMLDLIKSFINQGREPPAALLESALQQTGHPQWTYQPLHFWLGALFLCAGAIGFAALTWLRAQQGDPDSVNALFIAILLGAGAAACGVFAMIVQARAAGHDAS
jgi:hypothetical protein